jgi:hypothetical protein
MDIPLMRSTTKQELLDMGIDLATSTSRSARCPAASGSAWRSQGVHFGARC